MKTLKSFPTIRFAYCVLPAAVLALALFLYGCSGKAAQAQAEDLPTPENQTLIAEVDNSAQPRAETAERPAAEEEAIAVPRPAAEPVPEPAPAAEPAAAPVPELPARPAIAPVRSNAGPSVRTVSENKLTTVLETIARDMEAKKLAYVVSLGQDCSGIYHQIKDSVQARIPALRDPAKYSYPPFSPDRDSRQIAHWYYRHNNLHIVRDALADANRIRPGSVMFYGQTDKKYDNPTIEQLTTRGVGIMHVAVVTSVETDDAGNVTAYTIMHGRNKRHHASRTGGNCDCPEKGRSLPRKHAKYPFGNWNQSWVAVANMETPVN